MAAVALGSTEQQLSFAGFGLVTWPTWSEANAMQGKLAQSAGAVSARQGRWRASASPVPQQPFRNLRPSAPEKSAKAIVDSLPQGPQGAAGKCPAFRPPTAYCTPADLAQLGELKVLEVKLGELSVDLAQPLVWKAVTKALGLREETKVERLQGFTGGLNEDVWTVADTLLLKVVPHKRGGDADRLVDLARNFHLIQYDPSIAFPTRILRCLGANGQIHSDIILTRRCHGEHLGDIAARMVAQREMPVILDIFERLGGFLADFHGRYGTFEHSDFQPKNIFYDEDRDCYVMVDVAGMGPRTEKIQSDVEHFVQSIGVLGMAYGEELGVDGTLSFKTGYAVRSAELCHSKIAVESD